MTIVKVYQREKETYYPDALRNSVHFAHSEDGVTFHSWNLNYGILFAKGVIKEDNTIAPRSVVSPKICYQQDRYFIFAECMDEAGNRIEENQHVLWSTKDLIHFEEHGLVKLKEYGIIEEEVSNQIQISDELLEGIQNRWLLTCGEPVKTPISVGFADPVLFRWEESWYLLATNDNVNDIGLFIKKATTKEGLFDEDVETFCILPYNEEEGWIQTFWAPEFHIIGGNVYILFALGGKQWAPQCHMMRLKHGGKLENESDWEKPIRVCKMDGSFLAEDGISLDMTYFKAKDTCYLAWSYRKHIGTPLDSGSMIYIASTDEQEPWKITSEPVLLTRPLYGWENVEGTINNEGPYPLKVGKDIYLTYSGGDACGYSYAVGYLKISEDENLLDANVWEKQPTPFLHTGCVAGELGPGHNSFFYDEEGKLYVAYHIQERNQYHKRCGTYHEMDQTAKGFLKLK